MKRAFLISLLLLAVAPSSASLAHDKSKTSKETVLSGGKMRTYFLYVPESNNADKVMPLILLLHGSNRDGESLVDKWKQIADREEVILVAPNSSNSSQWSLRVDGPEFIRNVVEAVRSKYRINGRAMYLFGHSAGATFAIFMSFLESEYFAAAALHAGALTEQDYSMIGYAKRKTPLAIFSGTNDVYCPITIVRATQSTLKARGFVVELTEMPNHDHWYYDLAPKINQSALEFLKKYSLPEDPRYQPYDLTK